MIRRAWRYLVRLHYLAHMKDVEFAIASHERVLAALPAEIKRLHQIRLYWLGKAMTMTERKSPVNWHLGSAKVRRTTDPDAMDASIWDRR